MARSCGCTPSKADTEPPLTKGDMWKPVPALEDFAHPVGVETGEGKGVGTARGREATVLRSVEGYVENELQ